MKCSIRHSVYWDRSEETHFCGLHFSQLIIHYGTTFGRNYLGYACLFERFPVRRATPKLEDKDIHAGFSITMDSSMSTLGFSSKRFLA
jgi:hypothetical protein